MGQETTCRAAVSLPSNRAFVVQVAESAGGDTPISGRIEHIASGRATHFTSWTHLREFVEDLLRRGASGRGGRE